MYEIKLDQFEGPLDLLLQLIEKEDLDINQISLAKIADEYVGYVNGRKDFPLEELSDFLLVASKLLYIKSKSLLPYLVWDNEEEEAVGLEEQLKIYKEFLSASQKLEGLMKEKKYFFVRERIVVPKGFYPPSKLSIFDLKNIYAAILERIEPVIQTAKEIKDKVVSVKQKIDDLKLRLADKARLGFKEFVSKAKNKTEVLVSFLALLELVKQKIITVEQGELFEEIQISKF